MGNSYKQVTLRNDSVSYIILINDNIPCTGFCEQVKFKNKTLI